MLRIGLFAVIIVTLPILSAPPLGRPMQVTHVVGLSYPREALMAGVQGKVQLTVVTSSNGDVESGRVLAGPGVLASAAEKALKLWRFEPCTTTERRCETTVVFAFILGDEYCDSPKCPDEFSVDLPNMVEVRSSRARPIVN